MPYVFEAIGSDLDLIPLAARRAADAVGLKPSLSAWRNLPLSERVAIVEAGSAPAVDLGRVETLLAKTEPERMARRAEPASDSAPEELTLALGESRPLTPKVWSALDPLGRYVLAKLAARGKQEQLFLAYAEIVGESARILHLDAEGGARMVGVSEKAPSARRAVAESRVVMNADAFSRLERGDAPKGDVLAVARIAGIQGAKRTSDLVPLCHPLALTRIDVRLTLDVAARAVDVTAAVEAFDRTGVEMEALTAASSAALTVYDMLKAFDRSMSIGPTRLLEKSGGRSGDFSRSGAGSRAGEVSVAGLRRFDLRETALSVDEALSLVSGDELGGSVVFVGTVRDHNDGQSVTLLEYQAYASMAVREMERVALEIEAEIAGVRLAALHRTGSLRVGEAAVVCAAGAAHRDDAFRACRALIDRVKERVPIWKREHGPKGPYWIGWQDARPAKSAEGSHSP